MAATRLKKSTVLYPQLFCQSSESHFVINPIVATHAARSPSVFAL
jgi:hypothetical protein